MLLIGRKVCQKGRLLWDEWIYWNVALGRHEWERRVESKLKMWSQESCGSCEPLNSSLLVYFLILLFHLKLKSAFQMHRENWNLEQALEPGVTASQITIISPLWMLSPTVENIYSELACVMKPLPVRHINIHCTEKQMWAKFLDNSLEIS